MSEAITGGCLCGGVRFAAAGPAGLAGYCHCTDCRRTTGSAFNLSLPVAARHFRLLAGRPRGFTKRADSGAELTRHFCPDCGAPLYTTSPRHPELVYLKAGAVDDPALVRPGHQAWTRSAVAWARIPPDLPSFPEGRG